MNSRNRFPLLYDNDKEKEKYPNDATSYGSYEDPDTQNPASPNTTEVICGKDVAVYENCDACNNYKADNQKKRCEDEGKRSETKYEGPAEDFSIDYSTKYESATIPEESIYRPSPEPVSTQQELLHGSENCQQTMTGSLNQDGGEIHSRVQSQNERLQILNLQLLKQRWQQ